MGKLLYVVFFLIVTPLVSAEFSYQKCLDRDSSNTTMQYCNEQEFKHQDKILNKYYKLAMKNFSDNKKEKSNLKLAQRAWLKFRDLDCRSRSHPMRDGTAEYTMYQACVIEATHDRIKVLKNEY